ncbi:MAG: MBL fold metallo-hydrolase, partial [Spirochaetaceae bacterium]|nr:MBL fold metallo-hydrolase [Spirochaetaceae bacterium]
KGGGKPNIEPRRISKPVSVGGIMVRPVPVKHGCLTILGYTFTEQDRQAAYITDCSALPSAGLRTILPCQTLIIGALRSKPHPTHFTFDQAFELIRLVYETGGQTLRQAFFTHISHETSHVQIEELCTRYLSEHNLSGLTIAPAFDMLHIEC